MKIATKLCKLANGLIRPQKFAYDTSTEMVYSYELNLLKIAAFQKGKREEAIKKLKEFNAWRLKNGK